VTSSLAVFEAAIILVKVNAPDKTHVWKPEETRKYGNKQNFLDKSLSKRIFWHRIHSLPRRTDARGSADGSYRIWSISPICA